MEPERYIGSLVEDYLSRLQRGGKANRNTVVKYRRILNQTLERLREEGFQHTPKRIGEEELFFLKDELWAQLKPSTNRWQLSVLGKFLKYHENFTLDKMMLAWPQDNRINVNWLTPEEAIKVIESAQGIERIIIHLELRLGLRRVEVMRLRPEDVVTICTPNGRNGYINVHGKGRGGGKWRTISYAPETPGEVHYYNSLREEMVERAREFDPDAKEPKGYIIYQKGKRLDSYGYTSMDNIVERVGERAGLDMKLAHHTLRRTCGRLQYMAGVDLVDIMENFGHSDIKQTIRYLGITVDDIQKAQEKTYQFLQRAKQEIGKMPLSPGIPMRVSR